MQDTLHHRHMFALSPSTGSHGRGAEGAISTACPCHHQLALAEIKGFVLSPCLVLIILFVNMAAPIFEFVNKDIGEHTFHTGDPWPKEEKKDVVFHAFQQQVPGTEPVYDFWNDKDKEHTFHFGEPWPNEQKGEHPVFYAYPLGDDKNGLLQPVYSFWNTGEGHQTKW